VKLTRNFHFNIALLGVVPFVNVLFLVVIFYAMSSRFVLQPGLAVSLPISSFTVSPQPAAQIVSITAAPIQAVYFRDEKVSLEELGLRLAKIPAKERSLIIHADRATPYSLVVEIMERALGHGFSVVLATKPERS